MAATNRNYNTSTNNTNKNSSSLSFSSTLVGLHKELTGYLFEEPEYVVLQIQELRVTLRNARLASTDHLFTYSKSLTAQEGREAETMLEEREQFFNAVILLIDRQPDDDVRYELLCLLSELGAIETDFYKGGRVTERQDPYAFGKQALQTMVDIIPSVVNIGEPFIDCVNDSLIEVIKGMDKMYLIGVLPILISICKNPKFGSQVAAEFVEITDQLVTVFDFTRKLVRYGHVTSDDGIVATVNIAASNVPDESDPFFMSDHQVDMPVLPRQAFYQTCVLMNLCAHNPATAKLFHEHAISDLLAVEKAQYLRAKDLADNHCGECAVHMLIGTMARYCKDAAENFTKPHSKGGAPFFIVDKLVFAVKQIGTTRTNRRSKGYDHQSIHDANMISCLSGILYSSPSACKRVANKHSDINANTFITNLMKFAKDSTGELTSASLNAMLVITESPYLGSWRETMENECDLASKLQEIMKNLLLAIKSWDDSTRQAMIRSLKLMEMYSASKPEISAQLNTSDFEGYDRESIVFKIMQSTDTNVTDDVKLAASSVLRVVRLSEFDKAEIRAVVDTISAVPALVSDQTYEIMTNIIFLLFKMAMDYGGDRDDESCGGIFRDIYASEVTAAMYGNILRALEGDAANTAQAVDYRKRMFETASVKFLQTGWMQPEMNKGVRSDVVVKALLVCMRTEQEILSQARPKVFQDHRHLFLEQTIVGFDVRNMLKCIHNLYQRDIVAFRCFHQIAHCLDDHSHEDILLKLNKTSKRSEDAKHIDEEDPFITWAALECGHDIDFLAARERQAWNDSFNVLKSKYPVRRVGLRESDASKVAEVQMQYIGRVYKAKGDITEMKVRWTNTFEKDASNPRVVHLIMEDTELNRIVAFCGGGPKRANPMDSQECELYGFYLNNAYMADGDYLLRQLFMHFSHVMYSVGFKACVVWLCEAEQVLFASSSCVWLNQNAKAKRNLGHDDDDDDDEDDDEKMKNHMDDEKQDNIVDADDDDDEKKKDAEMKEMTMMNDNTMNSNGKKGGKEDLITKNYGRSSDKKPFLYRWDLLHNVWKEVQAHRLFLEENGVETMVHFLCKSDDVRVSEFDPTELEGTYKTSIRQKLEKFGHVLMSILEKQKKMEDVDVAGGSNIKWKDVSNASLDDFASYVEESFKQLECGHYELEAPVWSTELSGTRAENFLQTVALGLEKGAELEQVIQVIREEKLDQLHSHYNDTPDMHKKGKFMSKQIPLNTAAMLRAFHVLLQNGSFNVNRGALEQLRDPLILHEIRSIMASENYGVRKSVEDKFRDEYGIGMKFLRLIEDLILMSPHGLQESLHSLELYEVVTQSLHEMFVTCCRLLVSRDIGGGDPLHTRRSLYLYEEMMISRVCAVLAELINQMSFIQFFEGSVDVRMIFEGNRMCRQHALQHLFNSRTRFGEFCMTLLLYDVEMSTGLYDIKPASLTEDDDITDQQLGVKENYPGYYRDRMRIHIEYIVGAISAFEPDFRYRFVSQYTRSKVQAELGLRPSFMAMVLSIQAKMSYRAVFERLLTQQGVITSDDEVIMEYFFIEHGSTNDIRLLVFSNKYFYISENSFDPHTKFEEVNDVSQLKRYDYGDVLQLFSGYTVNYQLFALRYVHGEHRTVHVMMHRCIGVAERILQIFARMCFDDLAQPRRIEQDIFTEIAIGYAYSRAEPSLENSVLKNKSRVFKESLFTYCNVITDSSVKSRVVAWSADDRRNLLVEMSCDMRQWMAPPASQTQVMMNNNSTVDDNDNNNNNIQNQQGSVRTTAFDQERLENFLTVENVYDFKNLVSVDFMHTPKSIVVLTFDIKKKKFLMGKRRETFTIQFLCDTSRELWRRALKPHLPNRDQWNASVLPGLFQTDRHSGRFL